MTNSSTLAYADTTARRTGALSGAFRAVAYLRVSTEQQTFGYGIAKSERKTGQYIQRKGWKHVDTFSDEGVSGSLEMGSRPDFDRLMVLAAEDPRPFDVVVVEEGRAIGRTGRAFWRWVWALEDIGIHVAIVDGDVENTTPEGRREMRRAADYAETEWETIRHRTQGGLQEKAESGGWTGGRAPYGYRIALQGKKRESHLVIDFNEARCLRRAREVFVRMKVPKWRKVALIINAEGWRTRSVKPWGYKNLLARMTSTATLEAEIVYRKCGDGPGSHRTKRKADGTPAFGETVVIKLDPIFSEREVKEFRKAIARRPVVRPGAQHAYPLSGKVTNTYNGCERSYTGFARKDGSGRWYRCSGKDESYAGADTCTCSQVDADALEKGVWEEVQRLLCDPERLLAMAGEFAEIAEDQKGAHDSRIKDLDRQIETQNKAIAAVVAMAAKEAVANGEDPGEEIEQASQLLRTELKDLKRLRSEAAEWRDEVASAEQRVSDLRILASEARKNLAAMSPEDQTQFLDLLDLRVEFTGPVPKGRIGAPCSLDKWFRSRDRFIPDALSDEDWQAIEPLMPGKPRGYTYRQLIDAALYKARAGVRWDELPSEYGNHVTIHTRVSKWLRSGLWDRIMGELDESAGSPAPSRVCLPPLRIRGSIDPLLMPWVHELAPESTSAKTDRPRT
ncbi:recombinase family protein [Streptomyces sioyaensis]|uniref:recombinase family protein n=1 Tax=Streptomyces sioyaensis TaxID=67364 RepID=UPI0037D25CBB